MKNVLSIMVIFILLFLSDEINATEPELPGLEGDGQKATCYSTYQGNGNTTIWRCGTCQSVTNVQNPSDSGSCRF
ncbi:MAG: hypothetical protein KF763_16945 [Cyclobacteriaceae bacterium]|nr:hypothetical protein [Cyclobacteriaceae bacterium]